MAAPSNTVWGDKVKDYDRVGISISQSYTDTQCTVTAEVWFWTKYSLNSNYAKTYFEFDTTVVSDTATGTTTPIHTKNDSGSGWSTKNQVKLGTYTKTYDLTTNEFSRSCAVKVNGLSNTSSNVTATTSYSVDAKATYTNTIRHYKQVGINADGSTKWERADTTTFTAMYGESVTIPSSHVQTYTGFHSSGSAGSYWGTEEWSSKAIGSTFTQPAGAVSIEYYYLRDTYDILYNANGGSGAPEKQTKLYDMNLTLSPIIPTKSGYTFMGWGTSATDTSADYSAEGVYTSNSPITLYAVWKKTITLSYNANGGSGAPNNQSADVYNSTSSYEFTLSPTKPTRTGYSFLGWSTSSAATSATYSAGGNITLSQNTKLYAVWEMLGTLRIKQNSVWKSGLVWIKDNGEWKRGVAYKKVKGDWKRGL